MLRRCPRSRSDPLALPRIEPLARGVADSVIWIDHCICREIDVGARLAVSVGVAELVVQANVSDFVFAFVGAFDGLDQKTSAGLMHPADRYARPVGVILAFAGAAVE